MEALTALLILVPWVLFELVMSYREAHEKYNKQHNSK